MTNRKLQLAINWALKKGETTSDVTRDLKVSQRRVQQFVKHFKETREYPILNMNRHPKTQLTDEQNEIIQQAHWESFLGTKLLKHHISAKYGHKIIKKNKIHKYLLEFGWVKPNIRKKKHKR